MAAGTILDDEDTIEAQALSTSLDPYGQLVKMLMPRASCIAIYDRNSVPLWLSDGCDGPDLPHLIEEALNAARKRQHRSRRTRRLCALVERRHRLRFHSPRRRDIARRARRVVPGRQRRRATVLARARTAAAGTASAQSRADQPVQHRRSAPGRAAAQCRPRASARCERSRRQQQRRSRTARAQLRHASAVLRRCAVHSGQADRDPARRRRAERCRARDLREDPAPSVRVGAGSAAHADAEQGAGVQPDGQPAVQDSRVPDPPRRAARRRPAHAAEAAHRRRLRCAPGARDRDDDPPHRLRAAERVRPEHGTVDASGARAARTRGARSATRASTASLMPTSIACT